MGSPASDVRRIIAISTIAALTIAPIQNVLAEGMLAAGGTAAQASIRFKIVIPPLVQILANDHGGYHVASNDGSLSIGANDRQSALYLGNQPTAEAGYSNFTIAVP